MPTDCRHCHAPIADDPATELPPERCPHCGGEVPVELARAASETEASAGDDVSSRTDSDEAGTSRDVGGNDAWHRAADLMAVLAAPAKADADAPDATTPADDSVPDSDNGTPATIAPAGTSSKPAPSFVASRHGTSEQGSPRRRWLAAAVIAGLGLLLALQVLLADRARLAADADWRPLLSSLCKVAGCTLPPWREPDALVLLARDVRPHPTLPGVLRATATFRNDARWSQAWPRLVLTLSDVNGRAVGTRAFDAGDYLGNAPTTETLASGQSTMVQLDIAEPATGVVSFSFELH